MLQLKIATPAYFIDPVQVTLLTIGRFWSYVEKPTLQGCWPWIGGANDYGYGQFALPGFGMIAAHRLAYAFKVGGLDVGVKVRHSCDNPPCCNPWHLLGGTMTDNSLDCAARGRQGDPTPGKITPQIRDQIILRAISGEARRKIAARFGIHVCNVYRTLQKARRSQEVQP